MQGQNKRKPHNKFIFTILEQIQLQLSSDFDSGNLESVDLKQIIHHQNTIPIVKLVLTPSEQPFNPAYSTKPSTKTFFHFNIKCSHPIIIQAIIKKMTILSYVETNLDQIYRVCVGKQANPYVEPVYEKIKPKYMKLTKQYEQYVLQLHFQLQAYQKIYMAYHYPYSVEKLTHFLQNTNQIITKLNNSDDFVVNNKILYFRNQLLIQSVESRPINLVTLTQTNRDKVVRNQKQEGGNIQNLQGQQHQQNLLECKNQIKLSLPREPRISRSLFPYYDLEDRPYKFSKPFIMITCRVHPGETSASFALQGLINKLVTSKSPEIQFLLKSFVFMIVPMVNPDGVYHGTYRMDTFGHNLNRFYNNCVSHKQPSIFAIQTLMNYYSEDILFFLDMHSHPQLKGSFVYGNAYNSIYDQIQSQLFAKLLSVNSECFSYEYSSFTERNMTSKDINQIMTKDGSARVYAFKKISSNIHCYTVQMGYHGAPIKNQTNLLATQLNNFKSEYRRNIKQFLDIDYEEHGAAILSTIAQVYINSYNCYQQLTSSTKNQTPFSQLREQLGKQINQKEQRFKMMDGGLNKKLKTVSSTITNNLYAKIFKKYQIFQQNYKEYIEYKNNPQSIRKTIDCEFKSHYSTGLKAKYQSQTLSVAPKSKKFNFSTELHDKNLKYNVEDIELFFGREPMSHKISAARQLNRALKQKVNITPFEFQMPPQKKKPAKKDKDKNLSKMMLNFDPLPKIQKKTPKILTDRQKGLRQRRITSSLNKNNDLKIDYEQGKSFQKMTIDSKLNEILDCQALINCQNYQEFHDHEMKIKNIMLNDDQEDESPYQFQQRINQLNFLHRGVMYKKSQRQQSQQKQQMKPPKSLKPSKILKKYYIQKSNIQTRVHQRSHSLKNSPSKKLSIIEPDNKNFLPKLQIKSGNIRHKYEIEVSIQQKYEKQFKVMEGFNRSRKKSGEQFHL